MSPFGLFDFLIQSKNKRFELQSKLKRIPYQIIELITLFLFYLVAGWATFATTFESYNTFNRDFGSVVIIVSFFPSCKRI